jgi:hypothetical protein
MRSGRTLTLVPRASRPQGVFFLFAENGSADDLRARRPRYQAVRPWRTVEYLANYMRASSVPPRTPDAVPVFQG